MAKGKTPVECLGLIRSDELYTLPEFSKRLQLGEFALRQARRQGLTTAKIGRRVYIKGADAIAYFDAKK